MSTKKNDMDLILHYMKNNNIELTIDNNPTQEKIDRIMESIKRKPQVIRETIDNYTRKLNNANCL
ncbi:hypothetical protein CRN76_19130 [Chryseobacterium indologenes]|uniref:hypothetical protein n=1 Tax=Chryseobacterium indologenes TaxID=253 RepID=UPI000BFCCB7E|nr:hypothetical protein [Chryseobacterium indologenes]ATN07354.1 hypothetical protein CRN76_19130 [Chryseobacterium indologenes]